MKKLIGIMAFAILVVSCNSNSADGETTDTTTTNTTNSVSDSSGLTNPTAIDTVKHPAGMSQQNVISTDTAAMNMQNSVDKAKKAGKK